MSSLRHWVWLSTRDLPRGCTLPGFCIIWHPGGAYFAGREELPGLSGPPGEGPAGPGGQDLSQADQILAQCEALGIWVLTCQDATIPSGWASWTALPCVLYGRGRLPQMDQEAANGPGGGPPGQPLWNHGRRPAGAGFGPAGALVVSGMARGWTPPPSGGRCGATAGWCRCWAAALT
ncbi:MAG: hypothetical protein ACLS43_09515 [Evtepia gabavorous]